MKLIFIRHGEPNYEIDSLTEKGWREAELLSKRTVKWNVTDFYCSPLGRAKDTASFTLKNAGREAEILPWLREFDAPVLDPETGKRRIPWDFLPDVLDANRDLYDNNLWTKNPIMQTGNMDENYHFVTDGLDALLARYGYVRDGYRYHASDETNREAVIVCFCHLGVTCVALSHLLNMTPVQLWQGMFLAPTSVTIVGSEERDQIADLIDVAQALEGDERGHVAHRASRFPIMERLTIHFNFKLYKKEDFYHE